MTFKIFSHKLMIRKPNKLYAGFCSKLFKVSTTSVTLPEKHVKHAPESENLRGSGLPQLPLSAIFEEGHRPIVIKITFLEPAHHQLSNGICRFFWAFHDLPTNRGFWGATTAAGQHLEQNDRFYSVTLFGVISAQTRLPAKHGSLIR